MIKGHELKVQLDLTDNFKRKFLQWDGANVYMKEHISFLGQSDLTNHEMRKVVMQTPEPVYTQEATELMVKTLKSTYEKA